MLYNSMKGMKAVFVQYFCLIYRLSLSIHTKHAAFLWGASVFR
jgi:hypothetical protein